MSNHALYTQAHPGPPARESGIGAGRPWRQRVANGHATPFDISRLAARGRFPASVWYDSGCPAPDPSMLIAPLALEFGGCRLDLRTEQLLRDGKAVHLAPKCFEILCYLAEHPTRLVSKEELLEAVWPQTNVEPAALTVAIGRIRQALADDPRSPRFIETVHRRGYRFIAGVTAAQQNVWNPGVGRRDAPRPRPSAAIRARLARGRNAPAVSHRHRRWTQPRPLFGVHTLRCELCSVSRSPFPPHQPRQA